LQFAKVCKTLRSVTSNPSLCIIGYNFFISAAFQTHETNN
jgi:hypothetical protein